MVVNMIKWRPWSPTQSKKFNVRIIVHSIKGLETINNNNNNNNNNDGKSENLDGLNSMKVEIIWKGSKKKKVRKNYTKVKEKLCGNDVVEWEETFESVCGFYCCKDNLHVFLPWDVAFLVTNTNSKKKTPFATPAVINLAEFASLEGGKELDMDIPLSVIRCGFKCCPSLCISLRLTELKTTNELSAEVEKPGLFAPLSPCFGGASPSVKKDEGSKFKAKLRKVKSLSDYVSSRKSKKAYLGEASSESKFSTASDSEYNDSFDADSFEDSEVDESEESKEDISVQKPRGYGNLVHVNFAGGALDQKVNCEDDKLVYYSNKQLDIDSSPTQEFDTSAPEQLRRSPTFGILAWRKGKLSFKSSKVKGEPLLKKDYGEEGGDDIDYDRRQLSSDESMTFEGSLGSGSLISEFGDDYFAVGSWEVKELPSRDGSLKLKTQIFFATIDQRSERAAGESACTALVAVIADWFHTNRRQMPIKSDFDSLIREGSLQWRNLCEDEKYKERFPDKHFDLETVLQAKVRPLTVVPERSFIGFFHPEGLEEECFHFLKGAMSFDDIWGEICKAGSKLNHASEPLVYVVSWNDHFFLLMVDWDAFYIIDTLGERLFEGNNQAFVLKFDRDTTIERVPDQTPTEDPKDIGGKSPIVEKKSGLVSVQGLGDGEGNGEDNMVVVKGKECCKEYITSFLAAIPLRELQVDMKKGLMSSTPLHHRLQIEFNCTAQILPILDETTATEMSAEIPPVSPPNVQASVALDVPTPTLCTLD